DMLAAVDLQIDILENMELAIPFVDRIHRDGFIRHLILASSKFAEGSRRSGLDFKNGVDFDGKTARQGACAQGRAGMTPLLPKHLDQKIGCAVDHCGMILEVR